MYEKSIKCFGTYLAAVLIIIQIGSCNKDPWTDDVHAHETAEPQSQVYLNNIVGIDQFGRSFNTISGVKTEKQVGLFFWLWIGQPYASGIYDATNILNMPNGLKLLTDTASLDETISPNGQAHFWGQPLWGYYNSEDIWVIRKQIEMLTIAGVDFIFFDATNTFIYKNVYEKILKVIDEYQKEGWKPPKIAFYTHSRSFQTIRELYLNLYKPGLYPEAWFKINDKPLIIGYTDVQDDLNEAKIRGDNSYMPGPLSNEILNFFYFKRPQWPSDPVYADGFPWVEWKFPQPLHNNIMNVTVASQCAPPMSFSLTKGVVNWGRGWNPDTRTNNQQEVDKGSFFQRQWDNALLTNPDMITIGGWNEWIGYKQFYYDEYVLVDAVNKEFSRDIEPMRGGYEDAFYIQMIKNIRRYKGKTAFDTAAKPKAINIHSGTAQWNDVPVIGVNSNNDGYRRYNYGASTKVTYTQPAPANSIKDMKVTHDDKNIYFLIRAKDNFTANDGKPNWLNILVGTGEPSLKSWESYEFLIGQKFSTEDVSVERLDSDFGTISTGTAKYTQDKNIIQIECSREALGLTSKSKFYFKIAAGVDEPSKIMSYYTSGSSLPIGRLSYMYNL